MSQKRGKLEKRLTLFEPRNDEIGKYICYCNYSAHRGYIKENFYKTCEKRQCSHYLKFYITVDKKE